MIRHLPNEVQGRLRTGVALTGLAQCVEELALNAVDAGTTCVAVRVDLQSLTLQVVDNGVGISLEQLPFVAERYMTSKCHTVKDLDNLKYFGYRGEALASLRCVASVVEIITRSKHSTTTYSRCFHKGKALPICEAATPRPGAGTTVTARDIFYNLPVRKKKLNEGLELEKIRFRLAGIALIWPQISFSLRDDVTGNIILQTHKSSGVMSTFSSLFGGARAKSMREVKAESETFRVSGYISRESYSRKDLQFVFVNKRLVLKTKIHKVLDAVLGKGSLVRQRMYLSEKADISATQKQTEEEDAGTPVETGSPTKLFERYAVYIISIECPFNAYDITFDPGKTLVEFHDWSELTKLVDDMVVHFLKDENLLTASEPLQTRSLVIAKNLQTLLSGTSEPIPESEDPFEGNNEKYDEQMLVDQQKRRYAQGISTYNNYNSLFSHTVRRPRELQLKVNCTESGPSMAKKSKKVSTGDLQSSGITLYDVTTEQNSASYVQVSDLDSQCQVMRKNMPDVPVTGERDDNEEAIYTKSPVKIKQISKASETGTNGGNEVGEIKLHKFRYSRNLPLQHFKRKESTELMNSNHTVAEIRLPESFSNFSSLYHLRSRPVKEAGATRALFVGTDMLSKTNDNNDHARFHDAAAHTASVFDVGRYMYDKTDTNALPCLKRAMLWRSKSMDAGCFQEKNTAKRHNLACVCPPCGRHAHDDIRVRYTATHYGQHYGTERQNMVTEDSSAMRKSVHAAFSCLQRQSVENVNDSASRFEFAMASCSPSMSRDKVFASRPAWQPFTTISQARFSENECLIQQTNNVPLVSLNESPEEVRNTSSLPEKQGFATHELARIHRGYQRLEDVEHFKEKKGCTKEQATFTEKEVQTQSEKLQHHGCESMDKAGLKKRTCLTELKGTNDLPCEKLSSEAHKRTSFVEPAHLKDNILLINSQENCATENSVLALDVYAKKPRHCVSDTSLQGYHSSDEEISAWGALGTCMEEGWSENQSVCDTDLDGLQQKVHGTTRDVQCSRISRDVFQLHNSSDMTSISANFAKSLSQTQESMETQGFPVLSSQGFTPQLKISSPEFHVTSSASNLSIHSSGFSPADVDPMISERQCLSQGLAFSVSCEDFDDNPANSHELSEAQYTENDKTEHTGTGRRNTNLCLDIKELNVNTEIYTDKRNKCLQEKKVQGNYLIYGSSELRGKVSTQNNPGTPEFGNNIIDRQTTQNDLLCISSCSNMPMVGRSEQSTERVFTFSNDDALLCSSHGLVFSDLPGVASWSSESEPDNCPNQPLPSEVLPLSGKLNTGWEAGKLQPELKEMELEKHALHNEQMVSSQTADIGFQDSLPDSVLGMIPTPGSQILNTSSQSCIVKNSCHSQHSFISPGNHSSMSEVGDASGTCHKELSGALCMSEEECYRDSAYNTNEMASHADSKKSLSGNSDLTDPEFLSSAPRELLLPSDAPSIAGKLSREWKKSRTQKVSVVHEDVLSTPGDGLKACQVQTPPKKTSIDLQCRMDKKAVQWVPLADPATGSTVYVNTNSGHSLTEAQYFEMDMDQELETHSNERVSSRCGEDSQALKQLSPISHQTLKALIDESFDEDEEEESLAKWRDRKPLLTDNSERSSTEDLLSTWENPVFCIPEKMLQVAEQKHNSRAGRMSHSFLHPTSFNKAMLVNAKVLGQVDNKFVACLIHENKPASSTSGTAVYSMLYSDGREQRRTFLQEMGVEKILLTETLNGGLLVLFDQHAAHERIRLEQLISGVYEKKDANGEDSRIIRRSDVDPARRITLSERDVRMMQSFKKEFERIGICFEVDKEKCDTVHVFTMPVCMAQREANDRKRGKDPLRYEYVETMIREHTQRLLSTEGATYLLPQSVHRLMATHACKGAIKFGDKLSLTTCRQLIQGLASCDLPFQCAHGRPSLAPLISLSQLQMISPNQKQKPSVWKLYKKMQKAKEVSLQPSETGAI